MSVDFIVVLDLQTLDPVKSNKYPTYHECTVPRLDASNCGTGSASQSLEKTYSAYIEQGPYPNH